MVAYLHGKTLTIVAKPCNGPEFTSGEKIEVSGTREARKIAKSRNATPWNF